MTREKLISWSFWSGGFAAIGGWFLASGLFGDGEAPSVVAGLLFMIVGFAMLARVYRRERYRIDAGRELYTSVDGAALHLSLTKDPVAYEVGQRLRSALKIYEHITEGSGS